MSAQDSHLQPVEPVGRASDATERTFRRWDPALIERWTISDDELRWQAITSASTEDLHRLTSEVDRPVLAAMDEYLDQWKNPPEAVVWLYDIAQASLEARVELRSRETPTGDSTGSN